MSFKNWIGNTNNVEVFHGSRNPIERWDFSKHISGYYPGFYAWDDQKSASRHGEYVYSLIIDPKKFYHLIGPSDAGFLKDDARKNGFPTTNGSGYQDVEYLKSVGYDGIKRGNEYIIFDPSKFGSPNLI